jgi:hypothetical protein
VLISQHNIQLLNKLRNAIAKQLPHLAQDNQRTPVFSTSVQTHPMPKLPDSFSPELAEILIKCKEHNLFEQVHLFTSMNIISRKLIALGAMDKAADPYYIMASRIALLMDVAVQAYAEKCIDLHNQN